jgi:iron(III) transport system permease protein
MLPHSQPARVLAGVVKAGVLLVVLAPVVWLVGMGVAALAHGGFRWDGAARRAYGNSLEIALGAAVGALLLGLPYGACMARGPERRRGGAALASLLPLLLPPYATALAWILLLNREGPVSALAARLGWPSPTPGLGQPWMAAWVLASSLWPAAAWAAWAAFRSTPLELEEAARLEAADARAAWFAAWPFLRAGLAAAALAVFLLAFADFGVPNALGIVSYPRELVDRFNAEYDFAGAARLALPALVAALPLVALSRRALMRLEVMPFRGEELPAVRDGGAQRLGAGLGGLTLALTVALPLASLACYAWGAIHAPIAQEAGEAVATSAALGAGAAALTIGIALLVGRLPLLLDLAATFPYALPGSLVAIAAIAILNRPGPLGELYGTPAALLWIYGVLFLPFAYRSLAPGWQRVDPELLEEAQLAGAGPWARFRAVAWPSLAPYAAIGTALVFLLAGREMDATALLRTPGLKTLAFQIQDYLHFYPVPNVAALCLILVALQALAIGLLAAAYRRLQRRRAGMNPPLR